MAVADRLQTGKPELELVHQFGAGDDAAARQLYGAYCDPLLRFVVQRCSVLRREDAEEVVNDVFLSALAMARTYDGSCSVFTWLCSLARYRMIDQMRKRQSVFRIPENCQISVDDESKSALRMIFDGSESPDAIIERIDQTRVVQALLSTLTAEQREAIWLRYGEGFAISEVACIMRKSERSVIRLLERAKARPRKEFMQWLGEPTNPRFQDRKASQ